MLARDLRLSLYHRARGIAVRTEVQCSVEFGCYAVDELLPVSGGGLAEETRTRVPGSAGAVLHPAPVGLPGQEKPERFSECSGEVGYGGVGGDDEVERGDSGCGVG